MPKQPISQMLTIHGAAHATTASIEAESIGWIPLGEGAYLHVDDDNATGVQASSTVTVNPNLGEWEHGGVGSSRNRHWWGGQFC